MREKLALFSVAAFGALVAVSIWASLKIGVMATIADLFAQPGAGNNPWLVASLFDAYFGFLWFWLWVAYKEKTWLARGAWLVLILLGGNMAMAAYVLLALRRLPKNAPVEALLLRAP